jgi:D-tyrosyl-tRNA(Tyr) deacylase
VVLIGLLQRVGEAWVDIEGQRVATIGRGLMVLVGVEKSDTPRQRDRLLERLLAYRVFSDEAGKMNRSLSDIQGGLLLVPQFTLPADTDKGNRPSFSSAAPPELGRDLFEGLVERAMALHEPVACGRFGAEMRVGLVNDGPVTFWLRVR